jgi:hypothetical protein
LCCSLFKAWDGGRKRERELLLLLLLLLLLPMMMLLLLLTFGREVLAARSSIEDAMLAIQIAVSARWFSSLKFQCSWFQRIVLQNPIIVNNTTAAIVAMTVAVTNDVNVRGWFSCSRAVHD